MHRLSIFLIAAGVLAAQVVQPALTLEQKEEFLKHAKVVKTHGVKKGVTGTTRATLSDGEITHDASIQSIVCFRQGCLGPPDLGFLLG
jgi:hypothetical protein